MPRGHGAHQALTIMVAMLFFGSLLVIDAPRSRAQVTQIIWNSNQLLISDKVINSDQELLIMPGVRVLLGAGVSLIVLGNIRANATSANPIIFETLTSGQIWGNISLISCPRLSYFNNTIIGHGTNGILDYASQLEVELSNISYNARSGVNASDAEISVTDSYFTGNGPGVANSDSAIYLNHASGNILNNLMFNNNNGIFMKNGSTVHVKYGQMADATSPQGTGITVRQGSTPIIELVTIVGNYNGFVSNASHSIFRNNTVMSNARNGILLVNGDNSVLENNDVNNNGNFTNDYGDGIEINTGSNVTLTGNDINGNDPRGVYVTDAHATLNNNWIHGSSQTGLMVSQVSHVVSVGDHVSMNEKFGIFVDYASDLDSAGALVENNNRANIRINQSTAEFDHLTVKGAVSNIQSLNASMIYLENGTASDATGRNFELDNGNISTMNFTWVGMRETWDGALYSSLTLRWFLGIKVIDQLGHPNPGVFVNITPQMGPKVNRMSDAKGEVNWLALNGSFIEYENHMILAHSYSPYSIKVTYGKNSNSTTFYLDSSKNITIMLNRNQVPVLQVPFSDYNLPEDTTVYGLVNISGHFTDESPLFYTISVEEEPSKVHGVINGSKMDVSAPTKDWFGTRKFRIRATDNESLWAQSNIFNITVTPVDDPPVINPLGPFNGIVNKTITGTLTATDVDDPPSAIRFKCSTTPPAGVTLTLDANTGVLTFISTRPGNFSFWFWAEDTTLRGANNVSVWFNISYTNAPPTYTSTPGDTNVYVGGSYKYSVTATDPDGDHLVLKLDLGPAGMKLDNWTLSWAPNATQLGQFAVVLNLTDGVNPPVLQRFNVTSHLTNHAPKPKILQPAAGATLYLGSTMTFRGSATDQDMDPLVYSWKIDEAPLSSQLSFNTSLGPGTHKVSFGVSDGHVTAYDNITITVKNAPPPPKKVHTFVDNTCFLIAVIVTIILVVADIVFRQFRPR